MVLKIYSIHLLHGLTSCMGFFFFESISHENKSNCAKNSKSQHFIAGPGWTLKEVRLTSTKQEVICTENEQSQPTQTQALSNNYHFWYVSAYFLSKITYKFLHINTLCVNIFFIILREGPFTSNSGLATVSK